ncbi:MAG: methyltransferase domain-containing protein, partial [Candidatus Omnitrophica bacterium]|nr:methyltransferase domain-containing protein [Candidatus Omnitrophota bacterium]
MIDGSLILALLIIANIQLFFNKKLSGTARRVKNAIVVIGVLAIIIPLGYFSGVARLHQGVFADDLSVYLRDGKGELYNVKGPAYIAHGLAIGDDHFLESREQSKDKINALAKEYAIPGLLLISCNRGGVTIKEVNVPCIYAKSFVPMPPIRTGSYSWWENTFGDAIKDGDVIFSAEGWWVALPSGEDVELGHALEQGLLGSSSPAQGISDRIRALRDAGAQHEVAELLLQLLQIGDARTVDEAIDAVIIHSVDFLRFPCCINHRLIDAMLSVCEKDERLIEIVVHRVAQRIRTSRHDRLQANVLAELVMKLSWLTCRKKSETHALGHLLARAGYDHLPEMLRDCFRVNREMAPSQFGSALSGTDSDLGDGLMLRAFDKNWYFLEANDVAVGFAEVYLPTAGDTLFLGVRIFALEHARKGFGLKFMRWATQQGGSAASVIGLYPATDAHIQLFLRSVREGILSQVGALYETAEHVRDIAGRDVRWTPIVSTTEARAHAAGRNIFLKGFAKRGRNSASSPAQEVINNRRGYLRGAYLVDNSSSPIDEDELHCASITVRDDLYFGAARCLLVAQDSGYSFVAVSEDGSKREIAHLSKGSVYRLGRGSDNEIVVTTGGYSVSRRHAQVVVTDTGEVLAYDFSMNGTYVNDLRLMPNKAEQWSQGPYFTHAGLIRQGASSPVHYTDDWRNQRDEKIRQRERALDGNMAAWNHVYYYAGLLRESRGNAQDRKHFAEELRRGMSAVGATDRILGIDETAALVPFGRLLYEFENDSSRQHFHHRSSSPADQSDASSKPDQEQLALLLLRLERIISAGEESMRKSDKKLVIRLAREYNLAPREKGKRLPSLSIALHSVAIVASALSEACNVTDIPEFALAVMDDLGSKTFRHELLHLVNHLSVVDEIYKRMKDKNEKKRMYAICKRLERCEKMAHGWARVLDSWKDIPAIAQRSPLAPAMVVALLGRLAIFIDEVHQMNLAIEEYLELQKEHIDEIYLNICLRSIRRINEECVLNSGNLAKIKRTIILGEQNEQIDINKLVVDTVRAAEEDEQIKLTVRLGRNLPFIWANAIKMRYVMINWLTNAMDSINEALGKGLIAQGHVIIETILCVRGRETFIEIMCSDNGVGIPEALLGRLFAGQVTTKKGGSGLGLQIMKKAVEEVGGETKVFSPSPVFESGVMGSSFAIRLLAGPYRDIDAVSEEKSQSIAYTDFYPEVTGRIQNVRQDRTTFVFVTVDFSRSMKHEYPLKFMLHYQDTADPRLWLDEEGFLIQHMSHRTSARFRVALPKGVKEYTLRVSTDGGKTWHWLGWNVFCSASSPAQEQGYGYPGNLANGVTSQIVLFPIDAAPLAGGENLGTVVLPNGNLWQVVKAKAEVASDKVVARIRYSLYPDYQASMKDNKTDPVLQEAMAFFYKETQGFVNAMVYFEWTYVEPAFARQGFGALLRYLAASDSQAHGIFFGLSLVSINNQRALKFHDALRGRYIGLYMYGDLTEEEESPLQVRLYDIGELILLALGILKKKGVQFKPYMLPSFASISRVVKDVDHDASSPAGIFSRDKIDRYARAPQGIFPDGSPINRSLRTLLESGPVRLTKNDTILINIPQAFFFSWYERRFGLIAPDKPSTYIRSYIYHLFLLMLKQGDFLRSFQRQFHRLAFNDALGFFQIFNSLFNVVSDARGNPARLERAALSNVQLLTALIESVGAHYMSGAYEDHYIHPLYTKEMAVLGSREGLSATAGPVMVCELIELAVNEALSRLQPGLRLIDLAASQYRHKPFLEIAWFEHLVGVCSHYARLHGVSLQQSMIDKRNVARLKKQIKTHVASDDHASVVAADILWDLGASSIFGEWMYYGIPADAWRMVTVADAVEEALLRDSDRFLSQTLNAILQEEVSLGNIGLIEVSQYQEGQYAGIFHVHVKVTTQRKKQNDVQFIVFAAKGPSVNEETEQEFKNLRACGLISPEHVCAVYQCCHQRVWQKEEPCDVVLFSDEFLEGYWEISAILRNNPEAKNLIVPGERGMGLVFNQGGKYRARPLSMGGAARESAVKKEIIKTVTLYAFEEAGKFLLFVINNGDFVGMIDRQGVARVKLVAAHQYVSALEDFVSLSGIAREAIFALNFLQFLLLRREVDALQAQNVRLGAHPDEPREHNDYVFAPEEVFEGVLMGLTAKYGAKTGKEKLIQWLQWYVAPLATDTFMRLMPGSFHEELAEQAREFLGALKDSSLPNDGFSSSPITPEEQAFPNHPLSIVDEQALAQKWEQFVPIIRKYIAEIEAGAVKEGWAQVPNKEISNFVSREFGKFGEALFDAFGACLVDVFGNLLFEAEVIATWGVSFTQRSLAQQAQLIQCALEEVEKLKQIGRLHVLRKAWISSDVGFDASRVVGDSESASSPTQEVSLASYHTTHDDAYRCAQRHYYSAVLPQLSPGFGKQPLETKSNGLGAYNAIHLVDFLKAMFDLFLRKDIKGKCANFEQIHVLDVGCREGMFLSELKLEAGNLIGVHGIDIVNVPGRSKDVIFTQGSAEALPYADGAFDMVVSTSSLNFVFDPLRCIEEAYRVLRPGGAAYMHMIPLLVYETMGGEAKDQLDLYAMADELRKQGHMVRFSTSLRIHKHAAISRIHLPYQLVKYDGMRRYYQRQIAETIIPAGSSPAQGAAAEELCMPPIRAGVYINDVSAEAASNAAAIRKKLDLAGVTFTTSVYELQSNFFDFPPLDDRLNIIFMGGLLPDCIAGAVVNHYRYFLVSPLRELWATLPLLALTPFLPTIFDTFGHYNAHIRCDHSVVISSRWANWGFPRASEVNFMVLKDGKVAFPRSIRHADERQKFFILNFILSEACLEQALKRTIGAIVAKQLENSPAGSSPAQDYAIVEATSVVSDSWLLQYAALLGEIEDVEFIFYTCSAVRSNDPFMRTVLMVNGDEVIGGYTYIRPNTCSQKGILEAIVIKEEYRRIGLASRLLRDLRMRFLITKNGEVEFIAIICKRDSKFCKPGFFTGSMDHFLRRFGIRVSSQGATAVSGASCPMTSQEDDYYVSSPAQAQVKEILALADEIRARLRTYGIAWAIENTPYDWQDNGLFLGGSHAGTYWGDCGIFAELLGELLLEHGMQGRIVPVIINAKLHRFNIQNPRARSIVDAPFQHVVVLTDTNVVVDASGWGGVLSAARGSILAVPLEEYPFVNSLREAFEHNLAMPIRRHPDKNLSIWYNYVVSRDPGFLGTYALPVSFAEVAFGRVLESSVGLGFYLEAGRRIHLVLDLFTGHGIFIFHESVYHVPQSLHARLAIPLTEFFAHQLLIRQALDENNLDRMLDCVVKLAGDYSNSEISLFDSRGSIIPESPHMLPAVIHKARADFKTWFSFMSKLPYIEETQLIALVQEGGFFISSPVANKTEEKSTSVYGIELVPVSPAMNRHSAEGCRYDLNSLNAARGMPAYAAEGLDSVLFFKIWCAMFLIVPTITWIALGVWDRWRGRKESSLPVASGKKTVTLTRVGYCGLYCGACYHYRALFSEGKNIVDEARRQGKDMSTFTCQGCRSDALYMHPGCSRCAIRSCAQVKGLVHCGECAEFPCKKLEKFRDDPEHIHHLDSIDSLEVLKEIGIEEWLDQQQGLWKCGACGGAYSWYDMKCPQCRHKVESYNDGTKNLLGRNKTGSSPALPATLNEQYIEEREILFGGSPDKLYFRLQLFEKDALVRTISLLIEPRGIVLYSCRGLSAFKKGRIYSNEIFKRGFGQAVDVAEYKDWHPRWALVYYTLTPRDSDASIEPLERFLVEFGFKDMRRATAHDPMLRGLIYDYPFPRPQGRLNHWWMLLENISEGTTKPLACSSPAQNASSPAGVSDFKTKLLKEILSIERDDSLLRLCRLDHAWELGQFLSFCERLPVYLELQQEFRGNILGQMCVRIIKFGDIAAHIAKEEHSFYARLQKYSLRTTGEKMPAALSRFFFAHGCILPFRNLVNGLHLLWLSFAREDAQQDERLKDEREDCNEVFRLAIGLSGAGAVEGDTGELGMFTTEQGLDFFYGFPWGDLSKGRKRLQNIQHEVPRAFFTSEAQNIIEEYRQVLAEIRGAISPQEIDEMVNGASSPARDINEKGGKGDGSIFPSASSPAQRNFAASTITKIIFHKADARDAQPVEISRQELQLVMAEIAQGGFNFNALILEKENEDGEGEDTVFEFGIGKGVSHRSISPTLGEWLFTGFISSQDGLVISLTDNHRPSSSNGLSVQQHHEVLLNWSQDVLYEYIKIARTLVGHGFPSAFAINVASLQDINRIGSWVGVVVETIGDLARLQLIGNESSVGLSAEEALNALIREHLLNSATLQRELATMQPNSFAERLLRI